MPLACGISAVPMKLPDWIAATVTGLVTWTFQSLLRPMASTAPSRDRTLRLDPVTLITVPRTICGGGVGAG